ncbi:MAG: O-antigen ligase family protein [Pseudomonadales bacterium]|nr:O-antigen ligase family protein [Pseudomonadales bacterium]
MKKSNIFTLALNICLGIIIFLLPSNFFLKFFEMKAFVNGLRVDYLIPKLYLSDIFILILILIFLFESLHKRRSLKEKIQNFFKLKLKKNFQTLKKPLFFLLLVIFFLRQFWSLFPLSAIFYLLKLIELSFFSHIVIINKNKINKYFLHNAVIITLLFQSLLGLYQYINQKSLSGFYFFGEPNLNNYIGIAKSSLLGVEKILPYGTTPHPNVLGGMLALYLLFIFKNSISIKSKNQPNLIYRIFKIVVIFLSLSTVLLTQSISAIIALTLGLMLTLNQKFCKSTFKKIKNIFSFKYFLILCFSLLLSSIISINFLSNNYPDNPSLDRRSYLNNAAITMTKNNLVLGVGLNNFTGNVEKYSSNNEIVRFVQPAHNIFLLLIAESGIIGILIVVTSIYYAQKLHSTDNWLWMLILVPIALLDHYLVTLNSGLLLLVFVITLSRINNQ